METSDQGVTFSKFFGSVWNGKTLDSVQRVKQWSFMEKYVTHPEINTKVKFPLRGLGSSVKALEKKGVD